MPALNKSQLGLLNLLVQEEGAGIALVQRLAPVFGVDEGKLGPDLLRLVDERYLWPAGAIQPAVYFPPFFLPSPEGRKLIESLVEEASDRLPVWDRSAAAKVRTEFQASPTPPKMPSLQAMPREAALLLANAYLYWAQKPPGDRPRTPSHQLYVAAAWGYAHCNEKERFSRALRAGLKAWVTDGQIAELPDMVGKFATLYPHLAHTALEMAALVLEAPSRLLRQKTAVDLTSPDSLERMVRSMTQVSAQEARSFSLKIPDAHYLIEVGLTLEKLFVQAFALKNKPLYLTACQLLLLNIRQARSMIAMGGQVGVVLPMTVRMTLGAEQVGIALEGMVDLIDQGDERRKRAGLAVAAVAKGLLQATVIPLSHLVNVGRGPEAQTAQWALRMMFVSERGLAVRLARPLLYLERLGLKVHISDAPESALGFIVGESDVDRAAAAVMDRADNLPSLDPRAAQFVPLSGLECEVLEQVVDYLRLAQVFPADLPSRVEVLRSSLAIQTLLDRSLRPLLPDMRQSLLDWMLAARNSDALSPVRKAEILRQLAELEKANAPSQYLLRLPAWVEMWESLGPGEVLDAWNGWLDSARRSEIL